MGLQIRNTIKKFINKNKKYILYEYKDSNGDFDYERYRKIQEDGNKRKIGCSWVSEDEVTFLSSYILKKVGVPTFGICHGTRRGLEQAWFSKHLNNIEVIGTEISETAKDFPNTVHWDFHEINNEWTNKADFIYSNSFDHSYNPEKALCAWMDSLKKNGVCIIEHSQFHEPDAVSELDPFGATLDIMPYLILKWSKGDFCVREIITSPHKKGEFGFAQYLVIQKN